jgi:hypothetical protein
LADGPSLALINVFEDVTDLKQASASRRLAAIVECQTMIISKDSTESSPAGTGGDAYAIRQKR